MRKLIVLITLFAFVSMVSCISGHKSQSWHPRSGSKPKAGHNR